MAIRFPHCIVKGIDVAPTPTDSGTLPPNVSFEIDGMPLLIIPLLHSHRTLKPLDIDINHGLVHFYDQVSLD